MGPNSGPMLWVAAEECRNCIELHHSRGTGHGTLSSRRCEGFGTRRGQAGRVANGAPLPFPPFPPHAIIASLVHPLCAGLAGWLVMLGGFQRSELQTFQNTHPLGLAVAKQPPLLDLKQW